MQTAKTKQQTGVERTPRDVFWNIVSTAAPILMLVAFAHAHYTHWIETGKPTGVVLATQELILASIFLFRRQPIESSNRPLHWLIALLGSWGILLLRPEGITLFGLDGVYIGIQIFGAILSMIAISSLGRSFGIVAANRGIKTDGLYRYVRHPIYASYLVLAAGYILASLSLYNLIVVAVVITAQVWRISVEESVLRRDPTYLAYTERVRYRLIPFVY